MSQTKIENFIKSINWESDKNLRLNNQVFIPTVVIDKRNTVLGLAYSTRDSLFFAMTSRKGIYYSRSRMELWKKGKYMRNRQTLLEVIKDCDSDALIFVVDQKGNFCHVPNCYSCFSYFENTHSSANYQNPGNSGNSRNPENPENPEIKNIKLIEDKKTKISYAAGHCEKITLNFLEKIGIKAYVLPNDRAKSFLIKSDIDIPNPELVSWKPKDIGLAIGESDLIIYYRDFMDVNPSELIENYITLRLDKKFAEMRLCLVIDESKIRNMQKNNKKIRVATEYPHLTNIDELSEIFGTDKIELVKTFGNSEEYVKNGFVDAAIVIVNTGKTLADIGLKILKVIKTADMVLMVNKAYYRENPRVIRNIRNIMENEVVYFYSVDGPHGCFSNFYPVEFIDSEGRKWKSSEHYYQAYRFAHLTDLSHHNNKTDKTEKTLFEKVKNTATAKECYKFSWSNQEYFRKDWPEVKDQIMREALYYKYTQNLDLAKILLETGDKKIVEHSMNDLHYGMGLDNTGKNMLGLLLMELRSELQNLNISNNLKNMKSKL